MDRNEVKRLATKLRMPLYMRDTVHAIDALTKFAAKVVEMEREECAKVCKALADAHKAETGECEFDCDFVAAFETCGESIRARGEQTKKSEAT